MSISCPKCSSGNTVVGTQGFGIKKAVGGAVVAGPIGLAAGAINKNKTTNRCGDCGYSWSPAALAAKKAEVDERHRRENLTDEQRAAENATSFYIWLVIIATGVAGWAAYTYVGFLWAVAAAVCTFFGGILLVAMLPSQLAE